MKQIAKELGVGASTVWRDRRVLLENLAASELEGAEAFRDMVIDRAEAILFAAWEVVFDPEKNDTAKSAARRDALKALELMARVRLPRDPQPQVHLHAHQDAQQPVAPLPPNVREVLGRLPPVESRDYNGDCPTRPDAIDRPSLPPGRGDVVVGRKPV